MPHARTAHAVRLQFAPGALARANLSGAALTGDGLRVAGADACARDGEHCLQLDGLVVSDLHFCADDLCIPADPTMAPNGETLVFGWPAARPLLAANRDTVCFEASPTGSVSRPHGRGSTRAAAICVLPPALAGGKASWLVLYDAPGADRKGGEHTLFGELLHRD